MCLGRGAAALLAQSLLLSHQVGSKAVDEDLCVQVPRTDLCWGGLADITEATDI